jgi:hypothetical protein
MGEVVYEPMVGNATPLASGSGRVWSETIDVSGARTVHLMFGVTEPHSDVYWYVDFGPLLNGAFMQTNSGNFQDDSSVAIAVPVFGTSLFLRFENQSPQDETVDAMIYFIREVS